jgi:hypothetical protein
MQKSTTRLEGRDTAQQTTNIVNRCAITEQHGCVVLENQAFTAFILFIPCIVNGFTNLAPTNAQFYILYFTINLLLHV